MISPLNGWAFISYIEKRHWRCKAPIILFKNSLSGPYNLTSKMASKYLVFLILLAVSFATSIYLREGQLRDQLRYLDVVFWQLGIWVPWIVSMPVVGFLSTIGEHYQRNRQFLIWGCLLSILLVVHGLWFFFLSTHYSPLLDQPHTGYGVYPYFFIFWIFIDIVILLCLFIILKLRSKNDENLVSERASIGSDQSADNPVTNILLKKGKETVVIEVSEINWISAEDYYAKLHTSRGEFLLRETLSKLINRLPEDSFLQIHRSTIVKINFIQSLQSEGKSGFFVRLEDGSNRKVSRTAVKLLKLKLTS